jgi:hypothetical protein
MPRASDSITEVLADLARTFRGLRIRWYVFGAQALVLRGYPRATADLDVTVLLGALPTSRLVTALRKRGFSPAFRDRAFVAATRVLPVIHRATGFPVDIVLGGPGLEELFASAAENVRIGRLQVPVPTGTHLVVMKVLAGRPKDIEDAVALLATQASRIDAEELDELTKALAAALAEDDILVHLREARRRASRLPAGQKRAPRSRTRQRRGRR